MQQDERGDEHTGPEEQPGDVVADAAVLCGVATEMWLTAAQAGSRYPKAPNGRHPTKGAGTMTSTETGQITGTKDKDYNIIWFVEQCLGNALRMEIYAQDAERDGDTELAKFFRRAQGESRKGAEQGKELLARRLTS
jgi:hypothetical protein